MTEKEVGKRLAAYKNIADQIITKSEDSLTDDQLEQLDKLQKEVFDNGVKSNTGLILASGLSEQEYGALADTAKIASILKNNKERG